MIPVRKPNMGDEVRLISPWAWTIGLGAFVLLQWFLHVWVPKQPNAPSSTFLFIWGLIVGLTLFAFIMIVGYVHADARRRGMNAWLWTVLAIVIPSAMGLVVYFLLRAPLRENCPNCNATVEAAFNYCPRCHYELHPVCPKCNRAVRPGDTFCGYCGSALEGLGPRAVQS